MSAGEGRAPPAFQEYASAILASRHFRLMDAAARGICWTMRLECWTNGSVPSEPSALAAVLSLDVDQVAHALPSVMPLFTVEGDELRCAELDAYRAHLEARHLKLSEGGRAGAAITNAERSKPRRRKSGAAQGIPDGATSPSASPPATPSATPSASVRPLSTVQPSTAQQSQAPLGKGHVPADSWIDDYTAAQPVDTAAAYRQASRGE